MRALLEDQRLRDFFSREAEFLETRRSSLKYPFLNVPPPNHSIAPFAPHAAANRDLADAHGPPDLGARRTSSFHRSASGVSAASPSGRLLHPTPHAPALGALSASMLSTPGLVLDDAAADPPEARPPPAAPRQRASPGLRCTALRLAAAACRRNPPFLNYELS